MAAMKSDEEKFLEAMKIILGPHRKIGVCDHGGQKRRQGAWKN